MSDSYLDLKGAGPGYKDLKIKLLDNEDGTYSLDVGALGSLTLVGSQVAVGGIYDISGLMTDENQNVLTVKRAIASVGASSTDAVVVAAVSSHKIRVLSVHLQAGAVATTVTLNTKSGSPGTAITPAMAIGANGGINMDYNPHGWFQTTSGQGLSATTGAGSTVGIIVTYVEVP